MGDYGCNSNTRRNHMSKTGETSECPLAGDGNDFASRWLGKVGVNRSLLITLALVPFAWDGILWFRDAISWAWDSVTTWGT